MAQHPRKRTSKKGDTAYTVMRQVAHDAAIRRLREKLKPGDTVYTVLRQSGGMSRVIDLFTIRDDQPRWIGWSAAYALGYPYDSDREGIKVRGCGMDMGLHLVYGLSCALFPEGFRCIGPDCPSNDHTNGDHDHTPHHHDDGGCALRHRWL